MLSASPSPHRTPAIRLIGCALAASMAVAACLNPHPADPVFESNAGGGARGSETDVPAASTCNDNPLLAICSPADPGASGAGGSAGSGMSGTESGGEGGGVPDAGLAAEAGAVAPPRDAGVDGGPDAR